jgi:hypothetical protein
MIRTSATTASHDGRACVGTVGRSHCAASPILARYPYPHDGADAGDPRGPDALPLRLDRGG